MGFWGTGSFENDVAEDWIVQLAETGSSLIDDTLQNVEFHEGDDCCCALAAAELVAASGGRKARGFPDDLNDWLDETGFRATKKQIRLAKKAVTAIRTDSELVELFERDRAWLKRLEGLIDRLENPKPVKDRKPRARKSHAADKPAAPDSISPNQLKNQIKALGGAVAIFKRQPFDVTLNDTKAKDDDLRHLHIFPELEQIGLNNTRITDAGLAHLSRVGKLRSLLLNGTEVTGVGLVHLTSLPLTSLELMDRQITDEALKHVAALSNLKWLQLHDTNVTDEGVSYLTRLQKLEHIGLKGTKVTKASKKVLKKLRCDVLVDFDL